MDRPKHLDIKKDKGVTIEWMNGTTSFYPVRYLRRLSPSAEAKALRAELEKNPLAVLPPSAISSDSSEPLTIVDAELVGNYAVKIHFSDGHDTGLFSWEYLVEIDPDRPRSEPGGPTRPKGTAP